uniref:GPI mannosyltransferase 2 n=1 Tax=Salvator merianae TaxID=96440 RepID=A0A8D0B5F4_SALMN
MTSGVRMLLGNGRDLPCHQEVIRFAVLCRAITLLLQAFFNILIPDHDADAFSPPRLSASGSWDRLLELLLGGLSRWDAEHFLFIAEHGYVYEHNCAFFPLFPLSLRAAAETVLWPFQGFLSLRSRLLLSAAVLNAFCSALASWALYELSCSVLQCRQKALLAATLFCLTPANIFMAAAYSESMFASLVFGAMWRLEKGQRCSSTLLFSLATSVRSNGLINAGFLLHSQLKRFAARVQAGAGTGVKPLEVLSQILNLVASAVLVSVAVSLLFALFQFYAYLRFCTPLFRPQQTVPKPLLQLAVDKGYRVAALNGGEPPWCSWDFPVVYTYIQDAYWNVGFLRYFEPRQIPNFLLAAPTIALGSWAVCWYVAANPWHCLTLGLVRRNPGGTEAEEDAGKPASGFCSPRAFVYVVHAAALLVFGTFFMHVQVITRFLGSSSPVLYWFLAHLLYQYEPLLQRESPQPQALGTKESLSHQKRNENPMFVLLSNWKESTVFTKCILGYMLSYWLLGLVLHCNFFPWT